MNFWIGTSHPNWLWDHNLQLMVSVTRLVRQKSFKRANTLWFRDSGGFTQLQRKGNWDDISAVEFAKLARFHFDEIGNIYKISPRDWMCEPIIISGGQAGPNYFVGTKQSVISHQINTIVDYIELMSIDPDLPWIPVLQGWSLDDYLRCHEMYQRFGIELTSMDLVGVGTICRRQGTIEASNILRRLKADGLKMHAFGLKGDGIPNVAPFLESSDSTAWSYEARYGDPLPECEAEYILSGGKTHKKCNNCPAYASRWIDKIQVMIGEYEDNMYQNSLPL